MATTKGRSDDASSLLRSLQSDLDDPKWTSKEKFQHLERLKVLGRDVKLAEPIFTRNSNVEKGIKILATIGFEDGEPTVSQEALRCLANALLLRAYTRQYLVDLGCAEKAASRLNSKDINDEFLMARILFLSTYNTNLDIGQVVESSQIARNISEALARHRDLRLESGSRTASASPMEAMALCEILKLTFNITKLHPESAGSFNNAAAFVFQILKHESNHEKPLEQPVNLLINALLNFDLSAEQNNELMISENLEDGVKRLIQILDAATVAYPEDELDLHLAPLVTLLRQIYQAVPKRIQEYMELELLPQDAERQKPLGKSDTLPSRLLKITTSTFTPNLRDLVPLTLLEMSGNDTLKLIRNIGYGYASGFLMRNNMPIPEGYMNNSKEEDEVGSAAETLVNPVTGQRIDAEPQDTGPPMTDEEKQREAERLFVLIERLKKTGVVNIKNPVEQAVEDGRFEELD